jgi:hypothetical protein
MGTGANRTTRRFILHIPAGAANPTLRAVRRSIQGITGPSTVDSRIFNGKKRIIVFVIKIYINVGI